MLFSMYVQIMYKCILFTLMGKKNWKEIQLIFVSLDGDLRVLFLL